MSEDEILEYGRKQIITKARINRQQFSDRRSNFSHENELIRQQHDEMKENSKLISEGINNNYRCRK